MRFIKFINLFVESSYSVSDLANKVVIYVIFDFIYIYGMLHELSVIFL